MKEERVWRIDVWLGQTGHGIHMFFSFDPTIADVEVAFANANEDNAHELMYEKYRGLIRRGEYNISSHAMYSKGKEDLKA